MNARNKVEQKIESQDSLQPTFLDSKTLFADTRQISILHEGEIYTLRITSRGKLILTK